MCVYRLGGKEAKKANGHRQEVNIYAVHYFQRGKRTCRNEEACETTKIILPLTPSQERSLSTNWKQLQSRSSRRRFCLSLVPQCPVLLDKHSPETLASLQTHNGRYLVRGRETMGEERWEEVNRERKKERSQEKTEGKKLTINICHQLELLTSLHIIIHPPSHTHTH